VIVSTEQRWTPHGAVFVAPSGEWRPRAWEVAPIADDTTAREFVERLHYSRSYPAARRRFGLYHRADLVGVAVFSVPVRPEVLRPLPVAESIELGRFVLTDECPFNSESWFLRRCLDALAREGFAGVVAFSDPMPRTTAEGEAVFVGHVGQIYAASSAVLLGRSHADTIHLLPDGRVFSRRALAKIRRRETGWRYAVAQLVAAGADAPSEDLDAWLSDALARVTRRVRHPGNFKYAIPLTRGARKALPASLPYPRVLS
jgi:hypothetical protein